MILVSLLAKCAAAAEVSKAICPQRHIQSPLIGQRCVTDDEIYIKKTVERPQCMFLCLRDPNCQVINFNITGSYCLLGQRSCTSLDNDTGFVTTLMAMRKPCLKWESDLHNGINNAVPITDSSSVVVVRGNKEGNKIPGKWSTDRIYINYPWNGQEASPLKDQAELLIVSPKCTISWVSHDSTSGNLLPAGAVVGGHLDGIPLYVARKYAVFMSGHSPTFAAGYYDNVKGLGHFPYGGLDRVYDDAEIMVVQGWNRAHSCNISIHIIRRRFPSTEIVLWLPQSQCINPKMVSL